MRLLCRALHRLSVISSSGALMGSEQFLKSGLFSNPLTPSSHRRLFSTRKVPFYAFPSTPSSEIQPFCLLKANGYPNVSEANDPGTVFLEDSKEKNEYQLKILKQKLEELGLDTGRISMPGQFNHLLCPMCKGGAEEQKSLSLFIKQDGSSALWTCFRVKCRWRGSTKAFADTQSSYETLNKSVEVKKTREISVESLELEPPCSELVAYFSARMISKETMQRNAIMKKSYADKIAIAFTYWRDRKLIGCKYRDIKKRFWKEEDTEMIFYGLDDIKEASDVIIVEGEMDKLAMEEAGFHNCVSVPNGAPPYVSTKDLPPIEQDMRYQYLWNCKEYLDKASQIILATDGDVPGQALAEELARRVGSERCWRVKWPKKNSVNRFKDANEVLMYLGPHVLKEVIENAELYIDCSVLETTSMK